MSYRTIEIAWRPRTPPNGPPSPPVAKRRRGCGMTSCGGITASAASVGRGPARRAGSAGHAKGRYPGLSAQSAQQIIGEFCEAVDSCRQLRKNGQAEARYPWRLRRYHDVVYTNQDARIRDGRLILPHGTSGTLRIRLPDAVTLPGRLMEVRLSYGVVRLDLRSA